MLGTRDGHLPKGRFDADVVIALIRQEVIDDGEFACGLILAVDRSRSSMAVRS